VNQYLGESWDFTVNYADERRHNEGADATILPSQLFGFPPGDMVFFGTRNDTTYDSKSLKLELKGEVETGPLLHKVLFAYDRALRHIEAGSASLYLNSVDPATNVVTDLVPTLGPIFGVPSPRLGGGGDPAETGALVLDQVQWGDWVALAGWRMMRFDANTWNIVLPQFKRSLPSLGLLYRVTNTLSVYGNVAKGFVPNAGNLGFGNVSIPPEDAKQGELGVKWLIPERKAAFTAAVYNIQQKNVAIPDPVHNGLQCGGNVCYISVKGMHSRGVELEYSGQVIPGVEVRANYAYMNKESETPNLPGPSYAKHTANVWGTYRFGGDPARGWWVGAGVQAHSARNTMPGWAANPGNGRVDLNAGYDTKNWSLIAGVKNVADKRLYTLQSGMFYMGVPYQPREFFLTARYHFE
jgi:iron complex outermembrane receptor protein